MKFLMILISLLTLAACESKSSSESKKCTFNDEPVECSKEKPKVTTGNGGNTGSVDSEYVSSFTARVSAAYRIYDNQIEFLENTEDIKGEGDGEDESQCGVGTIAGDTYKYKLNGNSLTILDEEGNTIFSRISEDAKSIYGTWKNTEDNENGRFTSIFDITKNEIEIIVRCDFKK